MLLRIIRPRVEFLIAVFAIATIAVASAKGVTLIQQADGSVKTYSNVNIHLSKQTLWLHSSDGKGVLKIVDGACSYTAGIQRCLPYAVTLTQGGKTHPIAISKGAIFVNLSRAAQNMPITTEELAPHTVLILLHTQHGTYVTVKGTIDEVTQ